METASRFRRLIHHKAISITEGVRRAIAVWAFMEDATERGARLFVEEPGGTRREVEII
jgi:hypothetical protein